jgi:signal transduction histidine kinase
VRGHEELARLLMEDSEAAAYALRRLNLQDERAGPLVERVDRQTTAIARTLEELLDASRIAFGKISVQLEPFDLRAFLRDVLNEQEPPARQAGLQLISEITEDSCYVNADRMRHDKSSIIYRRMQSSSLLPAAAWSWRWPHST